MGLTFNPASGSTLNFGTVAVGASSTQVVVITHSGNLSVIDELDSITLTGPNFNQYSNVPVVPPLFDFTTPGQVENLTITFTPTSPGTKTATCTVNYHVNIDFTDLPFTATFSLTGSATSSGATGEAPGLLQSFRRELVPINGTGGILLGYFDETNFNDATDASQYIFKAEDIIADRVPTVRRVIITYFDLGVATLIAHIDSIDDTGATVTDAVSTTIGTAGAPGTLSTAFIDVAVTGYRPQLTLTRSANSGPVVISTVLLAGTTETKVTF